MKKIVFGYAKDYAKLESWISLI